MRPAPTRRARRPKGPRSAPRWAGRRASPLGPPGLLLLLLAVCVSSPADGQNPAAIARVRAGGGCPSCNLFQADLAGRALNGVNLSGARLRQADLSAAVFKHADLARADMRDVNAYGAVFSGSSLRGADLVNASLVGAYFAGADLAGARLGGANLSGAELAQARGLTPSQLRGACGDPSTTLPRGLRISPCR